MGETRDGGRTRRESQGAGQFHAASSPFLLRCGIFCEGSLLGSSLVHSAMSMFACPCLNLTVQLASVREVEIADSPFRRTVTGPLYIVGFRTAFSDLLQVQFSDRWRSYHCLHCNCTLCFTPKEEDTYYVDDSLYITRPQLEEKMSFPMYSKVFNILIENDPTVADSSKLRLPQDPMLLGTLQKRIDDTLVSEKKSMMSRIQAFEEAERARFALLQRKACRDRDSLYRELCLIRQERSVASPMRKFVFQDVVPVAGSEARPLATLSHLSLAPPPPSAPATKPGTRTSVATIPSADPRTASSGKTVAEPASGDEQSSSLPPARTSAGAPESSQAHLDETLMGHATAAAARGQEGRKDGEGGGGGGSRGQHLFGKPVATATAVTEARTAPGSGLRLGSATVQPGAVATAEPKELPADAPTLPSHSGRDVQPAELPPLTVVCGADGRGTHGGGLGLRRTTKSQDFRTTTGLDDLAGSLSSVALASSPPRTRKGLAQADLAELGNLADAADDQAGQPAQRVGVQMSTVCEGGGALVGESTTGADRKAVALAEASSSVAETAMPMHSSDSSNSTDAQLQQQQQQQQSPPSLAGKLVSNDGGPMPHATALPPGRGVSLTRTKPLPSLGLSKTFVAPTVFDLDLVPGNRIVASETDDNNNDGEDTGVEEDRALATAMQVEGVKDMPTANDAVDHLSLYSTSVPIRIPERPDLLVRRK